MKHWIIVAMAALLSAAIGVALSWSSRPAHACKCAPYETLVLERQAVETGDGKPAPEQQQRWSQSAFVDGNGRLRAGELVVHFQGPRR
jgi:hypothetical protein